MSFLFLQRHHHQTSRCPHIHCPLAVAPSDQPGMTWLSRQSSKAGGYPTETPPVPGKEQPMKAAVLTTPQSNPVMEVGIHKAASTLSVQAKSGWYPAGTTCMPGGKRVGAPGRGSTRAVWAGMGVALGVRPGEAWSEY